MSQGGISYRTWSCIALALALVCYRADAQSNSRARPAARDGVTVNKQPPEIKTRTFDPRNPPAEMPALTPPEAAVTSSAFSVGARVVVNVLGDTRQNGEYLSRVKVESVQVDLGLGITLWLPLRAGAGLKEHEEGHQKISEIFYDDAETHARDAARPYVGRTAEGTGPNAQAARDAAMKKIITDINQHYMAAVQGPSSKAQEEYDRITDHGRKKVPVDKAIAQSVERARRQ